MPLDGGRELSDHEVMDALSEGGEYMSGIDSIPLIKYKPDRFLFPLATVLNSGTWTFYSKLGYLGFRN